MSRRAASGVAQAALDEAVAYSQVRKTFGKPICEHQAIQLKLADMATQVRGGAAARRGRGADLRPRASAATWKPAWRSCSPPRRRSNVSLEAMRIHGGYGYSKEFTVERLYRDAPLLVIGEGTNELQRIIIARQLIERNPV